MFHPKTSRIVPALMLIALGALASAQNTWPLAHRTAGNNAFLPIDAVVEDLTRGADNDSPDYSIVDKAVPTIADKTVFLPVHIADGTDTGTRVIALDGGTGALVWRTEIPDEGVSRSFGSVSSVVCDPFEASAYYVSGATVYKLDRADGTILWDTEISDANTTPGVQYQFVNSSAQVTDDRIFVETYGGFSDDWAQIVALDKATGAVLWFDQTRGSGSLTPCFVDGTPRRIFTGRDRNGVACYNADTGALLWNSKSGLTSTWDVGSDQIFGSITAVDGKLYVAGNDFVNTDTLVICADMATGEPDWQMPAPSSDAPPIVMNGRVYVYGGGFAGNGTALLHCYNAATGALIFAVPIVDFAFPYRNPVAATNNRIYANAAGSLFVIDAANGQVIDSVFGDFTGPVIIDELGGLHTHSAAFGGASTWVGFGQTVPVELGSFKLE